MRYVFEDSWHFAESLAADQRAAKIMSLGTAQLNGLEPYARLKSVLMRLPE